MLKNYVEGQIIFNTGYYSKPAVIVSILNDNVLIDYIEEDYLQKQKYMVFPKNVLKERFGDNITKIKIKELKNKIQSLKEMLEMRQAELVKLNIELTSLKTKAA